MRGSSFCSEQSLQCSEIATPAVGRRGNDKRGTTFAIREEKTGFLLYSDAFGQISGLVYMTTSFYGNVIG